MTKQDNPTYYSHLCEIIKAIFAAEHACNERGLSDRLKAREITPEEYIEAVADELLSRTDKSEIEQ